MNNHEQLIALIRECRSHVYRQQHAGVHEQDRQDAAELLPRLNAVLNRTHLLEAITQWRNQETG